jgi:hypothetical protein
VPSSGALPDVRTILLVPIAQNKEQECPKLQVVGVIPAGDTNWERSSTAECSFDMREVKRAARFAPTIFSEASKAFSAMRSLGMGVSSVQLRVRAPF